MVSERLMQALEMTDLFKDSPERTEFQVRCGALPWENQSEESNVRSQIQTYRVYWFMAVWGSESRDCLIFFKVKCLNDFMYNISAD